MKNPQLWIMSGIAGIVGVASYLAAAFLPWPETHIGTVAALLLIIVWPIMSVVSSYGLRDFISAERDSAANQMAYPFAVAAFATVLTMIIVQLAVNLGVGEMTKGLEEPIAKGIRRSLRMIDMGIDIAWDVLISCALVLWGLAMRHRRGLGLGWAIPSVVAGVALLGLNFATFPWPPDTRGLFDIGPFIALYMTALFARMAQLGFRARAAA